jgi:hypothetical protein
VPEVGEQQVAAREVLREHLGCVQPRFPQQAGNVHERSRVLAVGRRVHGDEGRAVVAEDTEIAAEARVGGGALEPERGAAQHLAQPRVERGKAVVHCGKLGDSSIRTASALDVE